MNALPKLHELLAMLPELYQSIYGHPEFDMRAGRNVKDRLIPILAVHDALAKKLGRQVRVLDLGCAQGWFSLNLAKAGAQVVGLDLIGANINVCNMLALENPDLNARFKIFEIEKVPEVIPDDAFDMVLGLSVFHHLCFHNGKESVRIYMRDLFAKIPTAILELALASEGTDLASALPNSPEFFVDQMPFYRVLDWHPCGTGMRPLYFCSRRFSYLGNDIQEFNRWENNGQDRNFFFGADKVTTLPIRA